MNIAPLRNSIFKESGMFLALLAFIGGIAFYVDMLRADYEQQSGKVSGEAAQLVAKRQEMERRLQEIKDNFFIFEESNTRIKRTGLFIDSQAIRDSFAAYQPRFMLKSLSVDMTPIADVSDDQKFIRKLFVASKATVKVSVEAITDEDIYDLISAMQRDLPGFMKITEFSAENVEKLTPDVLIKIRKEGPYSLVKSDFSFEWYGLKSTEAGNVLNRYIPRGFSAN